MVFTVVIGMCCRGTFGPSRVAVSNEYLSKAIITSRHFPNTKIQWWARVYLIVFVKHYYRYALIMCNVPKQKQNSEEAGSKTRYRRRLINWHEIPNPLAERKYGQRQSIIFFPQMIFRFVHTYINASMGCYNELDSPFAKMCPRLSQSGNSFSNLNLNVMPSLVWQEHPWGCKTMGDAQQRQSIEVVRSQGKIHSRNFHDYHI